MTIETDIEMALLWRFAGALIPIGGVDLTPHSDDSPFDDESLYTQLTVAPVAWPNRPFTRPDPSIPYVRVDHLRNRNIRFLVKGSSPHLRQGILQATVVAPLLKGPSQAVALADTIAAHFPADLDLYRNGVRVRVQAAPDIGTPTKQDASWDVICGVRYEAYA